MKDHIDYREILTRNGFSFSKGLGQNFLISPLIPSRMAHSCGADGDSFVLEVGPGAGVLTRELSAVARRVVALEIDRRLFPVLKETLADRENCTVLHADVLKADITKIVDEYGENLPAYCCANLPYYITSPALVRLIECHCFSAITVMVQKEVARKLCASPGDPDYGSLTVFVQFYGSPRILFDVPAGCFYPTPKVDSAAFRIDLYAQPPVCPINEKLFFDTVHAAFSMRRKTLRNCINRGFSDRMPKEKIAEAFIASGIDPGRRGETLTLAEFALLSDALCERLNADSK